MTEVKGLQIGTADIEGASLYYEIAGAGPPLVLLIVALSAKVCSHSV